jgi:predicted CXXCH cytochrome family protein
MRNRIVKVKNRHRILVIIFLVIFCTLIGGIIGVVRIVQAAPTSMPASQTQGYAGSQACAMCHKDIHQNWQETRHASAFSSPIFQRDWSKLGSQTSCLACHTTGYDEASGSYSEPGVACEACHGKFQPTHPQTPMPITPDAELCSTCHKTTTDEWHASPHYKAGVQCQSCHNPHSQTPMADSITDLCTNCHKETGTSFAHSTHANAGLECSNCHMYVSPRTESPIEGLVPTGHTFTVGSDACIGCHQDTVHTRDAILKLTGEVQAAAAPNQDTLKQQVITQQDEITKLQARSTVRLYTGLAQGAIIGLITGGAAAWVVSKGIRVVEEEEEDIDEDAPEEKEDEEENQG